MSLIEVKNLDFSYNETKKVIKNISFDIKKGDYVTIIGHNGSGKSTLARLLIGLLEAKSGSIKIDGLELNEENVYKIREKIGIVFQNPDNQFIGSTVRDDIAFGLENHMIPQGDMDDIINKYAKEVGLEEFLDKEPTALSGGQKQRVSIARAILKDAPVIILDEATASVDPENEHLIQTALSELTRGKTVIVIAHRLATIEHADQILVVDDGTIAEAGTHEELIRQEGRYKKFIEIRQEAEGWRIQ